MIAREKLIALEDMTMTRDDEKIFAFYSELPERLRQVRSKIEKPLTLTEKILYSHASELSGETLRIVFDHAAIHDAAAQMILLQFALTGKRFPDLSTTVHCDRLITAEKGAKEDLARACDENEEIFDFLRTASAKYGIGFWKPGSGMMQHQLIETTGFPGGLMLGTDPTMTFSGGLGMLAQEADGVKVLDAMIGIPYEISLPRIIGIRLTGELSGWASPKDLILKLVPLLIGKKAKGAILEFFGPGAEKLSCEGKGTICSMASEVEAIGALFAYDSAMYRFLRLTARGEIAALADRNAEHLKADKAVENDPDTFYDETIEVDLSTVEPYIMVPFGVHRVMPLTELSGLMRQQDNLATLSTALIGSSTNSGYQDIKKAAQLAKQALKHGLQVKIPLLITPGSERIRVALDGEGLIKVLEDVGATFLTSSCGPCIGQWKRQDLSFGERNSIVTSYASNASGHNDNNPNTHGFIASPEVVMALALAGTPAFNPQEETLMTPQGLALKLVPSPENSVEPTSFDSEMKGFIPALEDCSSVMTSLNSGSERLQFPEPFKSPSEKCFLDLRLLVKAAGKCSIDQIAPAGNRLKYRAHLDSMSNHLFSLTPNSFREEVGKGKNLLTGSIEPFAKIAREYKKEGIGWIAVAYDSCGEGPCRDYASLGARYLGCKAMIATGFAPDFEAQLKKQGILALTFMNPADCERIREDDLIDLPGIGSFSKESSLELLLKHADGTTERLSLGHSYTLREIGWFRAGSILNCC